MAAQKNSNLEQPKTSSGFLGSIVHEVRQLGKTVERELTWATGKIQQTVDSHSSTPLLNLFHTGNVVQLVSKMTGCTLQILQAADGNLIIDARGSVGYGAYNASWTVINEGENRIRLHNNNNYLTIVDGYTQVVHVPPYSKHGVETKLHVSQAGEWALFQSISEPNQYIGVLPDGNLRPAKDSTRGPNAHFGVQLISSPYAQTQAKKQNGH